MLSKSKILGLISRNFDSITSKFRVIVRLKKKKKQIEILCWKRFTGSSILFCSCVYSIWHRGFLVQNM